VGLWQLMPKTARRLGLEVSATRDERLDPRRATEAAVALLAENHAQLGDWPLAIAAYNAGLPLVRQIATGVSPAEARARILASSSEYGRYLASAMASMILIDNPTLLD
jgi:peptidoglycan lytic transglycosylase D